MLFKSRKKEKKEEIDYDEKIESIFAIFDVAIETFQGCIKSLNNTSKLNIDINKKLLNIKKNNDKFIKSTENIKKNLSFIKEIIPFNKKDLNNVYDADFMNII